MYWLTPISDLNYAGVKANDYINKGNKITMWLVRLCIKY